VDRGKGTRKQVAGFEEPGPEDYPRNLPVKAFPPIDRGAARPVIGFRNGLAGHSNGDVPRRGQGRESVRLEAADLFAVPHGTEQRPVADLHVCQAERVAPRTGRSTIQTNSSRRRAWSGRNLQRPR
jgi:hypothetical protein